MGNTESLAVAKELSTHGNREPSDDTLVELEHLREGFRRVTSKTRNAQRQMGMEKDTFRTMVLSAFPRMPKTLGERLFDVLNTDHSGLLQWSELLSGLDLTQKTQAPKKSFEDNQCKLLFAIYDLNDSGQLQRDILDRFVSVIYGARGLPQAKELLDELFAKTKEGSGSLNYFDFAEMFQSKQPTFLFTWIDNIARHAGRRPNQAIERRLNKYSVVRVREEILKKTLLTMEEICKLEKWFQRALNGRLKLRTTNFVTETFGGHVHESFCTLLVNYIGEMLDFTTFCNIISAFGRGSSQAKRKFVFDIVQDLGRISSSNAMYLSLVLNRNELAEETLTKISEDEFINSSWQSLDDLVSQLSVGVYWHFDSCIKPKEPNIECVIVEERWKKYNTVHPSHVWYLLDSNWWYKWCSYTNFHPLNGTKGGNLPFPRLPLDIVQQSGLSVSVNDEVKSRPGPMKNWSLQYCHGSRRLKLDMVVGKHFHLIPEPVYSTLVFWYGGGPTFARTFLPSMELEVYPLVLRVGRTDIKGDITVTGEEVVVGQFSLAQDILRECCHVLIVKDRKTRLWFTSSVSKVLLPDGTYPYPQLSQDSILIVEIQDSDGSWPLTQPSTSLAIDENLKSYSYGLVGLDNLGNTCYMSSAIQCLSHSRLLCDYFRSGHYRFDLNLTNKLGTQGKLAVAFGNLLTTLWSTNKKSISPNQFRNALAKFNSHFDNNDQHDAQELLAFLLSGLSEDLNRVKELPSHVEQPDSAGRCDTVVADEWWQNYLRREVSIIVALFMGQYKSLLSCNTCHHQSASFEPFTFLQLPLQESSTLVVVLTIVFCSGQAPMRCTFELPRDGQISHVKIAINELLEDESPLIIACVNGRDHTVQNILQDHLRLSQIKEEEQVIAYQLEKESPAIESPALDARLSVGDAVGVVNERTSIPSHARITACNDNGTYDIAFWTGKHDFGYSRTRLIQYAGQKVVIYLVHRRMENATVYFTDPFVLRLFGTPLVLSIIPQQTTGYQLYLNVWTRLKRIFHWDAPPDSDQIHLTGNLPSTVEIVALGTHLEYTRFGFCLRFVTMDGMACSRCPWLTGCRGCLISSHPDNFIKVCGRETIAIDWDIQTMAEDYDSIEASKVEIHGSFESRQSRVDTILSIDTCLKDFTANEQLDEAYCSRCKALTPSTKKMDLWRLPPLLVIQLKRFQYTATSRKKLRNFVHFPVKGLNLQDYLVKTSNKCGLQYWQFLGGKLAKDEYDAVYDLYGVVNHIGALGGGHYVANVFSESDKKWKCFNDHLCRDIDEKDVVNPSAYILFYIRRDMKSLPVQEVFPVNATSPVSDEQIASLLNEQDASRCVIS